MDLIFPPAFSVHTGPRDVVLQMPDTAQLVNTELQPTSKQVNRAGTTHRARYTFYQGVANWPVTPLSLLMHVGIRKLSFSNCVLIDEAVKYLSIVNI